MSSATPLTVATWRIQLGEREASAVAKHLQNKTLVCITLSHSMCVFVCARCQKYFPLLDVSHNAAESVQELCAPLASLLRLRRLCWARRPFFVQFSLDWFWHNNNKSNSSSSIEDHSVVHSSITSSRTSTVQKWPVIKSNEKKSLSWMFFQCCCYWSCSFAIVVWLVNLISFFHKRLFSFLTQLINPSRQYAFILLRFQFLTLTFF